MRRSFSLSVSNFVTLGGSPTAAVLGVSGWRSIFLLAGICLLVMSLAWFLGITRIEKRVPVQEKQTQVLHQMQKKEFVNNSTKRNGILLQSGLIVLLAALFVQGALKDGVTTWIPVYIQETYGISPILAVAGTMVIPLCNLFGVWLAAVACRHMEQNEIAVSAGFFAVCAAALMILWISSGKSMTASMGMLALSTTTMMTVNTMLTAVLPSCFGSIGKASSMSGLLNSAVYSGGAVSAYGIGSMASHFGWSKTILIWAAMAAFSVFVCGFAAKKWGTYRRKLAK